MIYSLLCRMLLTLNGCLLKTVHCQNTKLIYYLHQPHQEQVSIHSYHPAIEKYSQHITSFWYPCTDYQVAPIWDCKVVLIGGISNTSGVRCPYTGIIDMLNLTFVKKNLTFNHNRTHFATELVKERMLFVCGGMNEADNACEVWTEGKLQFETANYSWDEVIGPRSNLTLHQLGDQLCAFGGTKMNHTHQGSTNKVHCFNTSRPITMKNYAIAQKYSLSRFRGGHSSIVHRQTDTSWKVFLCGGIGIIGEDQTCEALTIPNEKRKSSYDYCSSCLEDYVSIGKYCKIIGTENDDVGVVVGVDYKIPSQKTEGTYVAYFYATPLKTPLPVKHRMQEIQLFTIDDHCTVSKKVEDMLSSTTNTKSDPMEYPTNHTYAKPTASFSSYMGISTLNSDKECYTSAFLATIVVLSVIIAILAMVIIGMLTRRSPTTGATTQTRSMESTKTITEGNDSQELQKMDSNRLDAKDLTQNGITTCTSSGDPLELQSTDSPLISIICSKYDSNPTQHPVANAKRQSPSLTAAPPGIGDLQPAVKC